ncbi:MAG TPA: SGNH/GDSL hydrolase family protein [Jatrophihabitans sp.]|jgi:lysophospholipase L1-like esterase|uniref:SGNH/GDSL hydrolase family protein n=1 Tax=Jatrophihabitans sp. TaxID=1932789 RepID=UPI002F045903
MSRASRARRVVTAAAFGTGSLGALSAAAAGVVYGQTKLARRRIQPAETDPPRADGVWLAPGARADEPPLRLAMLGDSSAAGFGVHTDSETPAAQIAMGLSALARRPVQLRNVAVVGAQSSALPRQVGLVLAERPDLVVIMIGANDVTHRVRASESVRHLSAALSILAEHDVPVVMGTCPDLGTIRPIAQPLRWLARRMSRTLAAAQAVTVVAAGGRAVSLGDLLGPEFASSLDYFSADQFHPSAIGYARAAEVLLPSAAAALGLSTVSEAAAPFTSTRARPVAKAAARAAGLPGTEVQPAQVHGQSAGRRGPWARLIRRRASTVIPPTSSGQENFTPATMVGSD